MIGVVTGLRLEARCLRGLAVTVACSGARPARARAEASRLLAEGAAGLVSFGLAGGLAPELRPGDLILAEAVVLEDGRRLSTDEPWRRGLRSALAASGIAARSGLIAGIDRLLVTPAHKQALLAATGALAADMESHAVAEAASAAGKPFVVVRAISDPADRTLPAAAVRVLDPEGRIRLAPLLGMLGRPREVARLLGLGLQTRRALATLDQLARNAGRSLDDPLTPPPPAADSGSSAR